MAACTTPRVRSLLEQQYVFAAWASGMSKTNTSKTQDRMLKSAENWMAGFFGLEWLVLDIL